MPVVRSRIERHPGIGSDQKPSFAKHLEALSGSPGNDDFSQRTRSRAASAQSQEKPIPFLTSQAYKRAQDLRLHRRVSAHHYSLIVPETLVNMPMHGSDICLVLVSI